MIRDAEGVDTDHRYYDRFVLPAVRKSQEAGVLEEVDYLLGYPNAGTPIAAAFIRMARGHYEIGLDQLQQEKVSHSDGTRELGQITNDFEEGEAVLTIDDTATGGATKIEGYEKITAQGLTYKGLLLLVERDPLGSTLVRERTGLGVLCSMHWMSIVQQASDALDWPSNIVQEELDYSKRLFDWKVANDKMGSLPSVEALSED